MARSSVVVAICRAVLLGGCASRNPYDTQPASNRTASCGGLGALAGAVASNATAEGRAQNHRVEVTLRPMAGVQ